jgi:hypothetical protein
MHLGCEVGLWIADLDQARKEGAVAIRVVPRHVIGQPLYCDAPVDFGVATHATHEAAGCPKRVEFVH